MGDIEQHLLYEAALAAIGGVPIGRGPFSRTKLEYAMHTAWLMGAKYGLDHSDDIRAALLRRRDNPYIWKPNGRTPTK